LILSALYIYPVKSCAGISVASAEVDELGLVGDRRFMIVDATGRFLTQRVLPRMALIQTALTADRLTLTAAGAGKVEVGRKVEKDAEAILRVSVWKSEGLYAEDCGDEVAGWLEDFLGVACRLVRAGPEFSRPVLKPPAFAHAHFISFTDSCPFLIIGEASLSHLNDRLIAQGDTAVPMNRFRPNLVVEGSSAFAEDTWPCFRIGGITFHSAGCCVRCIVTTTDQVTAQRGKEPLRTLATYRRDPAKPADVNFGQNLIHETKSGVLKVGDEVQVLSRHLATKGT